MTYKKTKLAATFTWIASAATAAIIAVLVFGFIIGFKAMDVQGGEGFGAAVLFILGLIFGGATIAIGLALTIPASRLFKKSATSGNLSTAAYILQTLATALYVAFFVIAAIALMDTGYGYSIVLGVVAILAAVANVAVCVYCWISRKELV